MVEEIPGAISEGETLDEARENLTDALRMILECNRDFAREQEPNDVSSHVFSLCTCLTFTETKRVGQSAGHFDI